VSKEKKLNVEQEEKKRKEFLERNRQAASKCRTRKQEANSALQAKVTAFGHHNEMLKAQLAMLKVELVEVKKMLLSHADCIDPEFKAGMERHESMYGNRSTLGDDSFLATPQSSHSFGSMPGQSMSSPGMDSLEMGTGLNSGPATPSWDMQRVGSGMSSMSRNPYHVDGSLSLQSPLVTDQMLRAERKKKLEEQEEYMKDYRSGNKAAQEEFEAAMSRQNSRSSKASSGSSSSGHEGSAYTSAITTPETSAKETSCPMTAAMERATRRGMPQKNLENPRTESLIDPSLPGVSPLEFLAQQ